MCLRFAFLLITTVAAWLRLSRREESWKTAEMLILRHQVAVLQRRRPCRLKLNWADRALLAALLGLIPKARRQGLRLLVTPGNDHALAPRHRPPSLGRQVDARQDWPPGDPEEHPGTCPTAGPREPRLGLPQNPRRAGRPRHQRRSIDRMGDPQGQRHRPGPAADRACGSQFLHSQAGAILACDFFTVDLLDGTQAYVLAVIEHATRRIRIPGVTLHPTGQWTAQQARNLLMDVGGQAEQVKFMIRDRGSNFTVAFDAILADAGHPDRALQHPGAPHERDRRTLDRRMPPRVPVPHHHLEPGPPAADPERLPGPPQSAPACPLPQRRRAADTPHPSPSISTCTASEHQPRSAA